LTDSLTFQYGALGGVLVLAGWVVQRFGFYARTHQFTDEFPDWDLQLQKYFKKFNLEKSLIGGVVRTAIGVGILALSFNFDPFYSRRLFLMGILIIAFGIMTIFDAFLTRILQFVGLK